MTDSVIVAMTYDFLQLLCNGFNAIVSIKLLVFAKCSFY